MAQPVVVKGHALGKRSRTKGKRRARRKQKEILITEVKKRWPGVKVT